MAALREGGCCYCKECVDATLAEIEAHEPEHDEGLTDGDTARTLREADQLVRVT